MILADRGLLWQPHLMRRISIFVLNLIALALAASLAAPLDAWAAEKVSVRGGVHDGYTRIVLDGAPTKGYQAIEKSGSLTLTFKSAADFSVASPAPATLSRISGFSSTPNSVTILYPRELNMRHFAAGNRLIVDIKGPVPKKTEQTKPEPEEKPKQEEKAEAKPEVKPKEKAEEPVAVTPAANAAAPKEEPKVEVKTEPKTEAPKAEEPPKAAATANPDRFDAHMISITATQATGLAAFVRGRTLWLVVDKDDYPVYPQIAGPQKDKFDPFNRVTTQGGTAFTMKLPQGLNVYGEGGGLVWKVVLTPTARKVQPIDFKRSFDQARQPGGTLVWPVTDSRAVLDITDPEVGDTLKVVPVLSSRSFSGVEQDYVEFASLTSAIGLGLVPKVDGLKVTRTDKDVVIDAQPDGLALSAETDMSTLRLKQQQAAAEAAPAEPPKATETAPGSVPDAAQSGNPFNRIFAFDHWLMGGTTAMGENQRIIMSAIATKTDQGKAEDLITLAKMELANGRGPEALGYLDFASQLVKDLDTTPEFLALRGAAEALTGQNDRAFRDFSNKALDNVGEMKFWKSYALAQLEDWKQADDMLPKDVSLIAHYPEGVQIPVGLVLTEVALRAGDTSTADKLLEILAKNDDTLSLANRASLEYLRGESLRQQGDLVGMKEIWEPLSKGPDDLYRAKAGLALASQMLEKKEITPAQAIDTLEGLRYAWRGDELETAINYKLGRMYMDDKQPIKGLTILRQAASLTPNTDLGKQIATYMTDSFKNLYLTDKIRDLSPIDAVTVYDEFSELIPAGEEGDKVSRQLAERLVDADLLPRAENLLQAQITNRLTGEPGAEVALRLASIQLLDGKPDKALETLAKANEFMLAVPLEAGAPKRREIALLRARALSDQNKPEDAVTALSLLPQEPDVLRLRADIAWKAKRWQDAADTLDELVTKMNIDMTRPLDADQADTILNWAVALYLADNRYVLANLREKYADAMAQTPLSRKFDVVTRPRQNALLADRATINAIIGETDMFKGFLDNFSAPKPGATAPAATAPAPVAPPAAAPVSGE